MIRFFLLATSLSLLCVHSALAVPGQTVRIELPGGNRCLTLAEVEIIADGKNVAPDGQAKQSSTGHNGVASRAIDGNKNPSYGGNGQTHTNFQSGPWWEIDLGKEFDIERIDIWNRVEEDLGDRLDNFTIKIKNAEGKIVRQAKKVKAPQHVVRLDMAKKKPGITYLTGDLKPGKAFVKPPSVDAIEPSALQPVDADYKDPQPFAFKSKDIISLVGNGLPDRFQHEGWFETVLQDGLTGKDVAFRNMSFSGDRVDKMPRSRGFTPMTDYLAHVGPTAIFYFFGYNESWEEKPEDYTKKLVGLVRNFRQARPENAPVPRSVLFSPIAFENLNDPNFPTGGEHNRRLAEYTEATRKAAEEVGASFVDIYTPTLALFEGDNKNYTINGVHLNNEGNRQLALIIREALLGSSVDTDKLEGLRKVVADKNYHWHNRFRATDGNDVWGGRSGLRFVNGQSNRIVLQHELKMFDVMTANRDKAIWATAQGNDYEVDDSNVPAAIPVISNVGGGSPSSNAGKEGNVNYMTADETLSKLKIPEGFGAQVFASEEMFPDLANPVHLQVDNKGRVWAASWNTYPKWEPLKEMNDSLMIFEDTDGDGMADKRIRFAETHYPLGFEFWNGGVIVSHGPDIVFLKDTDGDDVADHREVLLMGVGTSDTHHSANNFVYGPDGGIYWQSGVFLVNNYEHPWGPSLHTGSSAMYRFDPRRSTITVHAGNSPNPHGTAFDYWGYCYANDGTGGRSYQVRPHGNGFRMYELLKKQVRPVSADAIISSDNFPDDMQGDFLVCNTIGYLGLKHYKLHKDGYEGRKLGEVWGTPDKETENFLVSEDRNFRPTDAVFGEDGALYVSDWQNVIIGHMQHNIRDPNRDHVHGRIFRIWNKNKPLQKPVKIDGASVTELLDNLKHPVDGVRHRSRVELSEHSPNVVMSALKQWTAQFDPESKEDAHHLLEALWVHQQFNVRNQKLLEQLLESPEPHAVVAAKTVQHFWTVADPAKGSGTSVDEEEFEVLKGGIVSASADLTHVRINTIVEKMKYDVATFEVKAGQNVKVEFVNPDFMPHNIVFVEPGAADSIANAAIALGAQGFAKQFIPDDERIFAASKLVDNKKSETLAFKAPEKPGSYQYVCTFPGHALLMRGEMIVK